MNILLVEDNADLAANIAEFLETNGHIIDAAADGITGLHLAVVNDYHAIILDLTLPGMDGLNLCKKLRQDAQKSTPVLMLTARDSVDEKLEGFAAGTDDYLVKPFSLKELHVRLQALHRRHIDSISRQLLKVADLEFDTDAMEVRRQGQLIALTPVHYKILEILMRNAPKVVKRKDIENAIWGDLPPDSDALRAHIHALRTAIDKPYDNALLHTIRGIGYRLLDPNEIQT